MDSYKHNASKALQCGIIIYYIVFASDVFCSCDNASKTVGKFWLKSSFQHPSKVANVDKALIVSLAFVICTELFLQMYFTVWSDDSMAHTACRKRDGEGKKRNNLVPVVKMYWAKATQMCWGCQSVQGRKVCISANMMAASADQLGMKIILFVIAAPHPLRLATVNVYSIVELKQHEDHPNISSNDSPPVLQLHRQAM